MGQVKRGWFRWGVGWTWDVPLRVDDMRRRGCGPRAECGVMVSDERYTPEARAMLLPRAREDCPAGVVLDNEGSFVKHYGAIVIAQLAQTNKIVSKSFNDVSHPGGVGESRWERKESTGSGGFAFSCGRLDYCARRIGVDGNWG